VSARRAAPRFAGQTIVITGASSGLGAALAEAFAGEGASLVLFARSAAELATVAGRCRAAGADPLVIAGDVTRPEDCAALVAQAMSRFGRLDVMAHCAGLGMWSRFDELTAPDALREIMAVNYWGLVQLAWHALPQLKRSRGLLLAVSSVQGLLGVPWHSGYAASKHAVQGFCDSLRIELRQDGVQVLTVLAHWIRGTRMRQRALGSDGRPRGEEVPGHGADAMPAAAAAHAIVRAVHRRRRALYLPGWIRWLALLSRLSPGLTDRLVASRVRREADR
jgi:NAD(P)-dependent dehydrogenase (short-subunit alcohol dehydrogenase family)